MPRTVMLLSTALCLLAASPAAADFEFSYEGHQYTVVTNTPRTWAAAAADAATRQTLGVNGGLVVIDDQAENDAIFAALLANISLAEFNNTRAPDGGGSAYVWIAGTDRQTEGVWLWDDDGDGVGDQFWQGNASGNPVGGLYNNWGIEPDDARSNQDAAGISLDGWPRSNPGRLGVAGQWNDVDQLNNLYYIVEFPVPEPSSLMLALIAVITILAACRRR